jgi:hypothetical protein
VPFYRILTRSKMIIPYMHHPKGSISARRSHNRNTVSPKSGKGVLSANAALIIESGNPQLTLYLAGFHQGVRPAGARAEAQRGAPLRLPALQQGLPLGTPF